MRINTPRLVLRPLKPSDARSITDNINDLAVSRWLLVVPYPYSLKDAKDWISQNRRSWKKKKPDGYHFGIELKSEKRIIGGIGLFAIHEFSGYAEVGYWLGRKYHRKGYGSEALAAILRFAFTRLKFRRLEAGVFKGNPGSGKLLEKFGFKKEGLKLEARRSKADGKIKDEYIYGLLNKNFRFR